MSRTRAYCFTINNWTDEDLVQCLNCIDSCQYAVLGFEICPNTNTPHIQGYGYWKNARFFTAIKKNMPRAHIEMAKGTPKQNREYCIKTGEFNEWGDLPIQGKRNDLTLFKDAILGGESEDNIINEHTECLAKYDRFYKRCRNKVLEEESKKMIQPEVIILTGETGIGKTRYIYDNENINDVYKVEIGDGSSGSIWWDSYDGEEVILIDDFHNNFKLDYMLRLLDRYPMKLNVKGGYTWKCAKKIYITSNIEPERWYPNCPEIHRRALMRRVTTIIKLGTRNINPIEELNVES